MVKRCIYSGEILLLIVHEINDIVVPRYPCGIGSRTPGAQVTHIKWDGICISHVRLTT